jgi:hypothetical protein
LNLKKKSTYLNNNNVMGSYQGTIKVGFLAHITETFDKWQLEPTTRTNRIN